MNYNTLISKIDAIHNGTWFTLTYMTEVPVKAAFKSNYNIVKYTQTTARKGVKYENLATYKAKLRMVSNAKEYAQTVKDLELPWGHWKEGRFGTIIEHTNKAGVYNQYLRIYSTPNKPKIVYVVNGKPMAREDVKNLGVVQDGYWNKSNETGTMTLNIENIWKIGK